MACWFSNKRRMNVERIVLGTLVAHSSTNFNFSYETQLKELVTMSATIVGTTAATELLCAMVWFVGGGTVGKHVMMMYDVAKCKMKKAKQNAGKSQATSGRTLFISSNSTKLFCTKEHQAPRHHDVIDVILIVVTNLHRGREGSVELDNNRYSML